MFSLRSRLAPAAVGVAILVAPLLGDAIVHADPIDDQRNRVEQLTDQLEALEERADILAEQLVIATDELTELEAEVAEAQAAVDAQQEAVAQLQGDLAEVAVQAYMGAGASGLGPIFGSTDELNDSLQRDEFARVGLSAGTATSDDLERELNQLAEDQAALEAKQDEAEDKRDEVAKAQQETEAQTAEYREARVAAEAELGELIAEEEARRARESYERMQAEAAAAAARAEQQQAQAQAQAQQATTARPSGAGSTNGAVSSGGNGGGGGGPSVQTPSAPSAPAPTPAPTPAPVIPSASSQAGTAVNAAMSQIGVPYRFAAASPGVAFDCSGLTSWAWGRAGVYLPHQSAQQYASLPHVPASAAQPGDLIFFYSPISHVGMYLGGGMMIHAPNSGSTVHTKAVNWGNVVGVARPG